jgi:4a-hydroxytetrahydrobiopterin dehydratase
VVGEAAFSVAVCHAEYMRKLLDDEVIASALAGSSWERHGDEITRTVRRSGFSGALAFVNAVGKLAERQDHHPDITIKWDTVTLVLTTHSAGGLTQMDLDLAVAIDALV